MLKLMSKGFGRRRSVDEQEELDRLKAKYRNGPTVSPLAKAIELKMAELRQRSN
jgi:hypothetical protein